MSIVKNNYCLKGNIKNNIKLALISDIHYSQKLKVSKLYQINDYLKDKNIYYICITGDIIDYNGFIGNVEHDNEFLTWIEDLGKITKVIISVGNHDIEVDSNYNRTWNDAFFDKMRNIPNIIFLDNDIYEDENLRFLGYTSVYDHHDSLKNMDLYIDDYKKVFGDIHKDKYNILMCHSPKMVLKDEIFTKLCISDSTNLVLSGHMHNGMYLPIMEKLSHSNRGLISPYKEIFPKIARGYVHKDYEHHSVDFIISGGVTKLSQSSAGLLMYFGFMYPPHVEIISIEGE